MGVVYNFTENNLTVKSNHMHNKQVKQNTTEDWIKDGFSVYVCVPCVVHSCRLQYYSQKLSPQREFDSSRNQVLKVDSVFHSSKVVKMES